MIDKFQEQVAVVTTVKIGIGDKIGITEGDDIWAGIRDTAIRSVSILEVCGSNQDSDSIRLLNFGGGVKCRYHRRVVIFVQIAVGGRPEQGVNFNVVRHGLLGDNGRDTREINVIIADIIAARRNRDNIIRREVRRRVAPSARLNINTPRFQQLRDIIR